MKLEEFEAWQKLKLTEHFEKIDAHIEGLNDLPEKKASKAIFARLVVAEAVRQVLEILEPKLEESDA